MAMNGVKAFEGLGTVCEGMGGRGGIENVRCRDSQGYQEE